MNKQGSQRPSIYTNPTLIDWLHPLWHISFHQSPTHLPDYSHSTQHESSHTRILYPYCTTQHIRHARNLNDTFTSGENLWVTQVSLSPGRTPTWIQRQTKRRTHRPHLQHELLIRLDHTIHTHDSARPITSVLHIRSHQSRIRLSYNSHNTQTHQVACVPCAPTSQHSIVDTYSEVLIRHTFTLRRPSSGQDTGEIENEEGEYYKTGRPNTHTSTDSSAVLLLNNSSHHVT